MTTQRSIDTQQALLLAIQLHWRQFGYAPSVRDLMTACELSSTSIVKWHVNSLVAQGRVTYQPRVARSIRLTDAA